MCLAGVVTLWRGIGEVANLVEHKARPAVITPRHAHSKRKHLSNDPSQRAQRNPILREGKGCIEQQKAAVGGTQYWGDKLKGPMKLEVVGTEDNKKIQ